MSRARGFSVVTPSGFDYIGSKRAKSALDCGNAFLVRPRVIQFIVKPRGAVAFDHSRCAKPAWGTDLKKDQIPASEGDSNLGQTFLTYPQHSLESSGFDYPAFARRGAGLG